MRIPNGPAMDNTSEYSSLNCTGIRTDLARADALIGRLERLSSGKGETAAFSTARARKALKLREECLILLNDILTYASIELDRDADNRQAETLKSVAAQRNSRLEEISRPLLSFLAHSSENTARACLATPDMEPYRFWVSLLRERGTEMLPLGEEQLAAALAPYGADAWDNLHSSIRARLKYEVPCKGGLRKVDAAELRAMRLCGDRALRHAAMDAAVNAWQQHEDVCATALNSIVGQRLELCRRRKTDFLAEALRAAGIKKRTLEAMVSEVRRFRKHARRALHLKAAAHGEASVHPLDVADMPPAQAGAPSGNIPFSRSIDFVEKGFSTLNPDMGAFVRTMAQKKRIDARRGTRRFPGNYCAIFMKSRTERVFYNLSGTVYDINGLAHELGHAFSVEHFTGKGLPFFGQLSGYGALTETPSIFAELLVRDELFSAMPAPAARLKTTWLDMLNVSMDLLLNSAMFDLERSIHLMREKGPLTVVEIKKLEAGIWRYWYGDVLSAKSESFWASSISYSTNPVKCFYSFIYTFGAIAAMWLLDRKERLGPDFYPAYIHFLEDFGKFPVEELFEKHFGANISQPLFWRIGLEMMRKRIDRFEKVLGDTPRRR
jgi:oligoendopeptidase F